MFLIYREEREYAQLDIGIEENPWYHSATNELWYDSELDEYRTARSEFDPIYGSEKPIKCTYYDGSYSEHQYNLDGSQKKSTYYSEYGSVTQADFFENGQIHWQIRSHMQSIVAVHILQQSGLNHGIRATGIVFLRRLEDKADRMCQLVSMF